ncbi:MAG TPA: bifunctional salicylyl-CoA 5-hydroxylase/oxidoreductase [Stellaceae bacterium]|nr:bifunctional salicylyl-CoA 5-hydroxylase/oxidoreductase [Stellaceae bacterium]
MDIEVIGGGPAGLYFSILMKRRDPRTRLRVTERNGPEDAFGWGVVFSDETMGNLAEADPETYAEIVANFAHWDAIDIHYQGHLLRSKGHGFSGLSRRLLLNILQRRARALGVELVYHREVDDVEARGQTDLILAADGANSLIRARYADAFRPHIDWRRNRFIWLGTTRPFEAFTFFFKENEHGLWRVHAYRFNDELGTFILETTEASWAKAGLEGASEEATIAYAEALFAEELGGHRLMKSRALWRRFPTVRNERWSHRNIVLMGDAAHTAHFSVGSGTKLAMEDAIALSDALTRHRDITAALETYEAARRGPVESLQRAAQSSLEWFEETERYFGKLAPEPFAASLLTRSLRLTHQSLKTRDPAFVATLDRWFAREAAHQTGIAAEDPAPPPMFTPFRVRDLMLANRIVVSAMCQYSAEEGMPNDWHLVHLGSRAVGGAGLVMTEMTDISREGRISPGCAGLYTEAQAAAWRRITDFVHGASGAKIGVQLAHAGRKGATKLIWEGMDEPLESGAWPLIAASPIPYLPESQVPKPMDRRDMDEVRDDFVRATDLALAAGFDVIELHFAHGYLLASFLSPLTNHRRDEYGGSLENRLRFPLEVFDAVRTRWPEARPMSVRLSATDWVEGGFEVEDAVAVAKALKEHGCDLVDVSAGQTVPEQKPRYGRLFQTPFADRIRHEAGMATMAVGAISSYADANSILIAGRADLVVLARAHLFDPYWTRHAAFEQGYELAWPDPYGSLKGYRPRFI